jgi:hypothetical protein
LPKTDADPGRSLQDRSAAATPEHAADLLTRSDHPLRPANPSFSSATSLGPRTGNPPELRGLGLGVWRRAELCRETCHSHELPNSEGAAANSEDLKSPHQQARRAVCSSAICNSAAQSPSPHDPYQRFADTLTNADAWLGATSDRYSSGVELSHLLLHAGLSRRSPSRKTAPPSAFSQEGPCSGSTDPTIATGQSLQAAFSCRDSLRAGASRVCLSVGDTGLELVTSALSRRNQLGKPQQASAPKVSIWRVILPDGLPILAFADPALPAPVFDRCSTCSTRSRR